ncbi:MAG: malto-oligosyltrehalose trehalohydrolase [Phycisphaerales bacterium]
MTPEPLPAVGAVPLDNRRTRFTVWAPRAERLEVIFPDEGRSEPMRVRAAPDESQGGYFELETVAPPGTLYLFAFPDGRMRPDPASRAQPRGVHGPSQVIAKPVAPPPLVDLPALDQHVLYELHVGTFSREGTFAGVIARLDDLRRLGVTAIELMPIAQFPGERNWGYDGVAPFAAQASYGGLAGLLELLRACHERGLALLLDVVHNHVGPEGNFLSDFGPYFRDGPGTPWGSGINFDEAESDHVREFFIQSALFWTRDVGVDGLRLDAVQTILDRTARPFLGELRDRVHAAAAAAGRRVLVIGESSDNDPRLLRDRSHGGLALDGVWNDDYHHALRAAITGQAHGTLKPFGDPALIARAVNDRFAFAGRYSSLYRRRHGAPARDIAHGRLVTYAQNHDQVGNRPHGDRLDVAAGLDGARLAAVLVLLGPFTPMVWMGEEYAERAPFPFFTSHADAGLVEAVRRGRVAEALRNGFESEGPDPQAESTFAGARLDWSLREHPPHSGTLALYERCIRLRRDLRIPARALGVSAESQGAVVLIRYPPADVRSRSLMLLANTSAAAVRSPPACEALSSGLFEVLLDTSDPEWSGLGPPPGFGARLFDREAAIPARTAIVLGESAQA